MDDDSKGRAVTGKLELRNSTSERLVVDGGAGNKLPCVIDSGEVLRLEADELLSDGELRLRVASRAEKACANELDRARAAFAAEQGYGSASAGRSRRSARGDG